MIKFGIRKHENQIKLKSNEEYPSSIQSQLRRAEETSIHRLSFHKNDFSSWTSFDWMPNVIERFPLNGRHRIDFDWLLLGNEHFICWIEAEMSSKYIRNHCDLNDFKGNKICIQKSKNAANSFDSLTYWMPSSQKTKRNASATVIGNDKV